jgi:hypothetical protein
MGENVHNNEIRGMRIIIINTNNHGTIVWISLCMISALLAEYEFVIQEEAKGYACNRG